MNYRVYGKYLDRDGTLAPTLTTDDSWSLGHVGFRTDWDGTAHDSFTVQGDAYRADVDQLAPAINHHRQARAGSAAQHVSEWWQRPGALAAQPRTTAPICSCVRTTTTRAATIPASSTRCTPSTSICSAASRPLSTHEIVWGAAYRLTANTNRRSRACSRVEPEQSTDQLFSGFIQDQIALGPKLQAHAGHEARAQRLQRLRNSTQRAHGLAAARRPHRVVGDLARGARADAPGARHRHRRHRSGRQPGGADCWATTTSAPSA